MLLRTAYVRFYRAFNFDYLRKSHPHPNPDGWDRMEDGSFYPYISIDIDPELTCVVGANESGKSQLLKAIEAALGERTPTPADFCRYSAYFTVAEQMRLPHFGLQFDNLTPEDSTRLLGFVEDSEVECVSSFKIFRMQPDNLLLYLNDGEVPVELDASSLEDIFPSVLRIDAERAVPNSVPISYLADEGTRTNKDLGPRRSERWPLIDPIMNNAQDVLGSVQSTEALSQQLKSLFTSAKFPSRRSFDEDEVYRSELNLAFDLLVTVGGISPEAFGQLQRALRDDDEGMANATVARMNSDLENSLNLAKWWTQDQQFRLAITVRDFDIVFTIRDRTGSEYSFAERSDGLRYFLSYLVQFLTYVQDREKPQILLMDEPDAYLSNQGQQDLLRIFQHFTSPTDGGHKGQVVFVTHSPFLIDKNRGDRIRVLDKGAGDEGVRVVRDVGQNHFEPLRTALGSFVGETVFIGNCNLMVEGMGDQILLAGMSDLLNKDEEVPTPDCLDLNRITLVPAGSASHIPYMVYLARGRDAEQPAIIVLLDGDDQGNQAAKDLQRGGARRKQLIPPEYVAHFGSDEFPEIGSERPGGPLETEDLIPLEVAVAGAKAYLQEMGTQDIDDLLSVDAVRSQLSESVGVFKAIVSVIESVDNESHIEKLGFARHVVAICRREDTEAVRTMKSRFAVLSRELTTKQRQAELDLERESISWRIRREIGRFLEDTLRTATRADVSVLCERIESIIDASVEGNAVAAELRRIRHDFDLDRDRHLQVADREALEERLKALKHAGVLASQPGAERIAE